MDELTRHVFELQQRPPPAEAGHPIVGMDGGARQQAQTGSGRASATNSATWPSPEPRLDRCRQSISNRRGKSSSARSSQPWAAKHRSKAVAPTLPLSSRRIRSALRETARRQRFPSSRPRKTQTRRKISTSGKASVAFRTVSRRDHNSGGMAMMRPARSLSGRKSPLGQQPLQAPQPSSTTSSPVCKNASSTRRKHAAQAQRPCRPRRTPSASVPSRGSPRRGDAGVRSPRR